MTNVRNETPPPNRPEPVEPNSNWVEESHISPQMKKILLDMKRDHEKRMKLIADLEEAEKYFENI